MAMRFALAAVAIGAVAAHRLERGQASIDGVTESLVRLIDLQGPEAYMIQEFCRSSNEDLTGLFGLVDAEWRDTTTMHHIKRKLCRETKGVAQKLRSLPTPISQALLDRVQKQFLLDCVDNDREKLKLRKICKQNKKALPVEDAEFAEADGALKAAFLRTLKAKFCTGIAANSMFATMSSVPEDLFQKVLSYYKYVVSQHATRRVTNQELRVLAEVLLDECRKTDELMPLSLVAGLTDTKVADPHFSQKYSDVAQEWFLFDLKDKWCESDTVVEYLPLTEHRQRRF